MFAFLFVCSLLVPLSMVFLGNRWKKNPPGKNSYSGYRTAMSCINQDTWNYAHKYWGRLCFILGMILIAITVVSMLYFRTHSNFETAVIYLVFIQIAIMTLTIVPTEIKLNKVFTKQGYRK